MKNISRIAVAAVCVLTFAGCETEQAQAPQANQQLQASPQALYRQAKINFAKRRYPLAFQQIQVPARTGYPDAQYALGYMYFYGQGTPVDLKKAKYWFTLAANQGHVPSKKAVAMMNK